MELELRKRLLEAFNKGDIERAQKLRLIIEEREGLGVRPVEDDDDDSSFIENLLTGFGAGAANVGEMASLGAAALLEEEDELEARKAIQSTFDAITPEGGDKDSFTYKVGQGFGSVAGIALPAVAAAAAGAPVAVGTGIAGLLGVGAAAGEASERARAAGATEVERSAATLRGAPIGLLEILPLGRFIRAIDVPVITKLANNIGPETVETMGQKIHSAALSGGFEAAQEATAGVLQNLNEQEYNALAETFGGVGEEATIGGIVGATLDLFLPGGSRSRGVKPEDVEGHLEDEVPPEERVAGLLPAPDTTVVVDEEGTARTPAEAEQARRDADEARRQQEIEDEKVLGDMPSEDVRSPTDQRNRKQAEAELAREQQEAGDLFPDTDRTPKEVTDEELADTMAMEDAEQERLARLEDDDQMKPEGDMVDQARYEELQDKQVAERTAAEDIELARMQREEDAAREAEDLEIERMVIADEDKAGQAELEAQVKERKPKERGQQEPLPGMQSKTGVKKQGLKTPAAPKTTPELKRQELPELPPAAQKALADKGIEVPKQKVQPAPVVEEAKVQPASKKVQPAPKTKVAPQPVATTPTKSMADGRQISTVDPETGKLVVDTPIKLADADRTALAPLADVTQYVDEKGKDREFRKKRPAESVPRYEDAKDKFNANRVIAKYLNAYANPESALRAAAFEVADPKQTAARVEKGDVDPIEVKRRGTGGKSAKAVVEWAKNNLPAETNAAINKQIEADKKQAKKSEKVIEERQSDEGQVEQKAERAVRDAAKESKTAKERVARRKRREAAAQRGKEQQQKKDVKDTKKAEKAVKKQPTAEQKEADKQQRANEAEIKKLVAAEKKRLESAGVTFDPVAVEGVIANSVNNDSKASYESQQRTGERETAEQFFARVGKTSLFDRFVSKKDAAALSEPLPIGAIRAINDGDLVAALNAIATSTKSPRVKNIASAMARKVGSTKVVVASPEFMRRFADSENEIIAGVYVHSGSNMPANLRDTIFINGEENGGVHTLLHEMTHALTLYELNMDRDTGKVLGTTANAKRIAKLWEDFQKVAKDRGLDAETHYGLTNINEFVAEAFTSSDFRQLLSRVHPDGKFADSKSLWEQFSTTVINMVRRLMGLEPSPTLLTEVDNVINSMLTPADQGIVQFPEFDGTRAGAARLISSIGDAQKKLKGSGATRQGFADGASELIDSGAPKLQQFILNLVGSQGVGDVARKYGFGDLGLKLHKMFNLRRGAMDKADENMRMVTRKLSEFAKAKESNQPLLDKLIYDPEIGATITQVDPELSKAEAKKKYNDEDFATWEKQNKIWNSAEFGKEGREMYTELRDAYKNQYLKLKDVIFTRLDSAQADGDISKEAVRTLKQQVMEQMFSNKTLDVYFPLTREGDYVLSYSFKNPANPEQAYVVRRFTTKREMERVKAELEQDSEVETDSIEADLDIGKATMYNNAPPDSFAGKTLKLLKEGGADSELQDAFMRMYMDHLPETSFAQSLRRRQGTLGYEGNSLTALRTKGFDLARQVVQIQYSAEISKIRSAINEVDAPEGTNKKAFAAVKNHMDKSANFAINGANKKGMEKYVKNANQLAFIYTIGFNVSSAIVNLSQIPLVVLPYLSARHGLFDSTAAITRASQIVGGTSDNTGAASNFKVGSLFSVDDLFDLDANGNYTAKANLSDGQKKLINDMNLEVLVKAAAEQGQLTKSFLPDALAVHEQGRKGKGGFFGSLLDSASSVGAQFGFAQAERFNRQTAMVATYDLTLRQLRAKKKSGEKYYAATKAEFVNLKDISDADLTTLAANEAIYQTQETNGGAVLETSPAWAREGIGRVAFMYKTYGLQMYYTMFKSAKLFVDNIGDNTPEGKELRRLARQQIAGVYLSSALMAGVQGVPLYGLVRAIADMFFLDDDDEDADTIVRKYIGEGFYKGPIVDALGVDFATRIKLTDLVIQTNRYNNDPSTEEIIGFHLGGPALSVGNRFIRGVKDLYKGETERGLESITPAALSNIWKSTFGRFAREGGMYTRRGDPIYDDMSFAELAFQGMGFAPAEYTFAQEQASQEKRLEKGILAERQNLLKKLNVARRFGDVETAKEIRVEIREFNKKHRRQRITGETIRRSRAQFKRTSREMHNGVAITKSLQQDFKRSRDEYSEGFEILFGKDE